MASEPLARKLTCEACGAAFGCTLGGPCWCSEEAYRLPLPPAGSGADCLCPDCLRLKATELAEAQAPG
jgi:hypothetical protein